METYLTAVLGLFAFIGLCSLCRWTLKKPADGGEHVIDHVKIGADEVDERAHRDKLIKAQERHGKPFKVAAGLLTYERVHRLEPRSHDLTVIDEASRKLREGAKLAKQIEAQTNVSRIGRK